MQQRVVRVDTMRVEPVPWAPLLARTGVVGFLIGVVDLLRHVSPGYAVISMVVYFLIRYVLHCAGGMYRLGGS